MLHVRWPIPRVLRGKNMGEAIRRWVARQQGEVLALAGPGIISAELFVEGRGCAEAAAESCRGLGVGQDASLSQEW